MRACHVVYYNRLLGVFSHTLIYFQDTGSVDDIYQCLLQMLQSPFFFKPQPCRCTLRFIRSHSLRPKLGLHHRLNVLFLLLNTR